MSCCNGWRAGLAVGAAVMVSLVMSADGQDQFPTPIARGPLTLQLQDFATVGTLSPSSAAPRLSVMTADPLGRYFVNDQRGGLFTVPTTGGAASQYLNLRDFDPQLSDGSASREQGFNGFTFHPDFANVGTPGYGKFYTIHETTNTSGTPDFLPNAQGNVDLHTVLWEWRASDPTATTFTPANAAQPFREVIRFDQPYRNHNSGHLSFNTSASPTSADRDNLYLMLGDGGNGGDPDNNAQDTDNAFGKILRINPTGSNSANGEYGIVADNTFASDGDAATAPEVYAYGLRNPQRFGWDNVTGDLFAADIGQNAVEEINLITNGGNYGWDEREGSFQVEGVSTPGAIDPVAEYDHTNTVASPPTSIDSRAVTMGEVVRGSGIPDFDGNLVLGDNPTGLMFYLDVDSDPLDGGQDGLFEIDTEDDDGNDVRLLSLINATRAAAGLSDATRADLRYSVGIDGRVFVLNKQDGVIRELVAIPEPAAGVLALLMLAPLASRRRVVAG